MHTRVIAVDPVRPDPSVIAYAAAVLARGELVVVPTETVYGLAAVADDPLATESIFVAKGRPRWNPLIVHVNDLTAAKALTARWPDLATALAERFWPGPLSFVLDRHPAVCDTVTASGPTVALRCPRHPVLQAVLHALGRPIAAPSANRFQRISPTTAEHALKSLDGRVSLVLDAGPTDFGIESTVVDLTVTPPKVLRPGALSLAELRSVAPSVSLHETDHESLAPSASPGTARKHYAPLVPTTVVRPEALTDAVSALADTSTARVGAVIFDDTQSPNAAVTVRLPCSAREYAAALFAALYHLEDSLCTAIVIEAPPDLADWTAVRDRLRRAST